VTRSTAWTSAVVPPASWAIVMSFGVVSFDLATIHQPVLSAITLWFAVALWLFLFVVLSAPLAVRRGRFRRDAGAPVVLASVAATAVLGTRFAVQDQRVLAAALLLTAAAGWGLLVPAVLKNWRTPTVGIFFIVGVATDSLALLSAILAVSFRAPWLLGVAGLFLLLALALYVVTAARFDVRQLLSGHGDHWIAGGALAIAALTAGKITQAAVALGLVPSLHHVLTLGALILWCLAVAWIVPLLITECVRPRLGYDVRRWATVFPFGMYAACSITIGRITGFTAITGFGWAGVWVAVALTLIVFAGLIRHVLQADRPSGYGSTDPPALPSTSRTAEGTP
jgi:tellurite resistance protein TehA-like permease